MNNLEQFLEFLGEKDYDLICGQRAEMKSADKKFMSESYIESHYSGRTKLFLLHNIVVSEFEPIYNRYLNKLMMQPLYENYLFVSYIDLVKNENNYNTLIDIEKGRDQALKKMYEEFCSIKEVHRKLYQKYIGTSYNQYYETMNEINYQESVERAHQFLDRTEVQYSELLGEVKEQYFNLQEEMYKVQLLSLFWRILEEDWGGEYINAIINKFNLKEFNNIQIIRKNVVGLEKTSCCIPIKIPEKIKILLPQKTNIMNIKALLHEIGHAISFSQINTGLDCENKWIYNEVIQEMYAILFEELLSNSKFTQWCGIRIPQGVQLLFSLRNLYQKRLIAAKTIFQYSFFQEYDLKTILQEYEILMSRALGVTVRGIKGLMDVDYERPSVQYFMAYELVEEIQKKLCFSFGDEWYRKENAYKYLQTMWKEGGKITPYNIKEYI